MDRRLDDSGGKVSDCKAGAHWVEPQSMYDKTRCFVNLLPFTTHGLINSITDLVMIASRTTVHSYNIHISLPNVAFSCIVFGDV